ncbi:MAG TPA: hypothetical protein PK263_00690 [bacterium]|nr:hypothetical protein [bacterium]
MDLTEILSICLVFGALGLFMFLTKYKKKLAFLMMAAGFGFGLAIVIFQIGN